MSQGSRHTERSLGSILIIGGALLVVGALIFSLRGLGSVGSRARDREGPTTSVGAAEIGQQWIIPDDTYYSKYPPVTQSNPTTSPVAPNEEPNGPIATGLVALLSPLVPPGAQVSSVKDIGSASSTANAAGQVVFTLPDGSLITATQQRLTRPLPYSAVGVEDSAQIVTWPSGTQVVTNQAPSGSYVQVLMVDAAGIMVQAAAGGIPAQGIAAPLSADELLSLMKNLDAKLSG